MSFDYIDVTPMEEPDPDWFYTDPAGHEHRWVGTMPSGMTIPTIRQVIDVEATDEYPGRSHYECRECGERVRRGFRAAKFRQYMRVSL